MSIINIALSGLNANKVALDVTSQNVANINTPGYSRQQANMAAVSAYQYTGLTSGNGVEITGIRRVTDQYVVRQTWLTGSQAAFTENFSASMGELETMLSSDAFSISAGLDDFYAALNDASVEPESSPLRLQVLNEAEALTNRFSTLSESLLSQHRDLSEQRMAAVAQANSLLENIADVNGKIVEMQGSGANPALLEDERDLLIEELSSLVDIRTTQQQNGSLQVTLATGQPLVLGDGAAQLKAVPDASDPYLADLFVEFSGQEFVVTGDAGGQIGAISQYQTDILVPAYQALDDMAAELADELNSILASGQDLNGNPGQPLFTYNAANPAASLEITAITAEELAFSVDGTPGNNEVLQQLIDSSNTPLIISGYGNISAHDAFASMISQTAIQARQASSDDTAASALYQQAIAVRDGLSAVNEDEEAANLMVYSNAYQANMKVISTANELFDTVLQLF
ncbi:flagellar hook-associated protein FlgK [Vibrio sp. HA2012]|uniref:flagellar hook-associated protein FlgK n=1 Tax=Vibrio sp. HA2012 TaxID=1971595 RepID=UPI000C2B75B8|nr:flagellar hook-associated protein FlgK [Vibrio sp. HA2012]PJC86420.1 flagellar hook-associated protein FlgK [Vibrio sp. HA2012]